MLALRALFVIEIAAPQHAPERYGDQAMRDEQGNPINQTAMLRAANVQPRSMRLAEFG